jgi:hypothetical protein
MSTKENLKSEELDDVNVNTSINVNEINFENNNDKIFEEERMDDEKIEKDEEMCSKIIESSNITNNKIDIDNKIVNSFRNIIISRVSDGKKSEEFNIENSMFINTASSLPTSYSAAVDVSFLFI